MFEFLERCGAERSLFFSDRDSGLRAVVVIDSLALGPAAGGVRTRRYGTVEAAVDDARRLARAMTMKCALSGLDAGGAKCVVLDHPGMDRRRAFHELGRRVQELGGLFRTSGDLGTTAVDLERMAQTCDYVSTDEASLASSVARGLLRCVEACAALRRREVAGLRVAVQGAGAIGATVCRTLAAAGATIVVADVEAPRAEIVAGEVGGEVVPPEAIISADVDVVSPCAIGGVIDVAAVESMKAWALCGAANNILAEPAAAGLLGTRGILYVPDVLASAGAVIDGIGKTVMGLSDRTPLIDRLGDTARDILEEAMDSGRDAEEIARRRARARLESR